MQRGLLHRAVHVWLCDFRTGGLVLRKYGRRSAKLPGRWGPTCHGEVLTYGSSADPETGPHAAELSVTAAVRSLQEQLSLDLQALRCHGAFRNPVQEEYRRHPIDAGDARLALD